MNNLYYYYIPTNNNKLFSLLSVIETSCVGDKILLLTKKREEVEELTNFFRTKGILTSGFLSAADFENLVDQSIDLYITSEDFFEQAKSLGVTCVVSISCSLSFEECKRKAAICARPEKQILIELIGKSDFSFVQSLYKFSQVEVNRFATIEKETIEKNKDKRTACFIEGSLSTVAFSGTTFQREKGLLESVLVSVSLDEIKKLYVDLLVHAVYGSFPKMNELVVSPSFKIPKECRLELNKGEVDGITVEKIKSYLAGVENFLPQYILELQILADKTLMTVNVREFSLEKITQFIAENLFDGVLSLEVKTLDLKNNKVSESTKESRYNHDKFEASIADRESSKFEGSREERRSSWRPDRSQGRDGRGGGGDRGASRFGNKRRFGGREFGNRDKEFHGEERSENSGERSERSGDRYSKPYGGSEFKRFGGRNERRGGSFDGGYDSYKSGDRDYKKSFSREKSFYKKDEFGKDAAEASFSDKERNFSRDSFYRKDDQKFERRGGDYSSKRRREFQPRRDDSNFFMKRDNQFSKFNKPKKSSYESRDDIKDFEDYTTDV